MDEVVCVSVLDKDFNNKVKGAKRVKIVGDYLKNNLFRENYSLEYVEISGNVEEIGDSCFRGCSRLKEVILPNGLKKIGEYVFCRCGSLNNIVIPDTVIDIGENAFAGCHSLKSVTIPESILRKFKVAFNNSYYIEEINLSGKITELQSHCFDIYLNELLNSILSGTCAFVNIKLSGNIKKISVGASLNCKFLKSVVIPDSVTEIDDGCFKGCINLREIKLSSNLEKIGDGAFLECNSLKSITIPDSVLEIGNSAFSGCSSLESVVISNKSRLNEIGKDAFYDCSSLKNMFIPNTVTKLGGFAFSGCCSIEKLDLPDDILVLEGCFSRCVNLRTVKLPNNLQTVDSYTFENCSSLKELSFSSKLKKIKLYHGRVNLDRIIFSYDSYEGLVNFINDNLDFLKFFKNYNLHLKTKIIFSGPKLSVIQKSNVTYLCKFMVTFIIENKNSNKEVNTICNDSDDISNIINEINILCDKLPNELKDIINKKVNVLLDKYNKDKERLLPKYGVERPVLSFGDISIDELRPRLLSDLGMIKLSLTTKSDIIKFIAKLEVCSNILDKEVDELLDDYDSIEDMVRNIMYYSKYLDDYRKNRYRNKVRWIIQYAVITASREFTESNNELKLNDKLDVKLDFRLKLTNLYNEIEGLVSNTIPFKNLSMALKSNNERDNVGDDINSFLECIRYVINHISNEKYKGELNVCYSNIIGKYSSIIDNLLEQPGTLDELKYEKVEFDFRNELQSFLEVIRDVLFISDYELKISDNSIINQLNRCLGIIHDGEIVNITEKEEKEALVYSVILINNSVISDSNLSNDTKNLILLDLVDIINRNINEIGDSIIDVNEYRTIQINILKEIMRVKLKYEKYISDVDKYKRCLRFGD